MAEITITQALESKGTFHATTWQGEEYQKREKYVWNEKAGRYEQFILINSQWHSLGFPCSKQTTQLEWLAHLFQHTPVTLTDKEE